MINTAIIFAGGKGTRLHEYTHVIPKPMIEIVGKPLLIHLLNYYIYFGVENIIVLTGYKHDYIEKYFQKKYKETRKNVFKVGLNSRVKLVYTGINSQTGKRLKAGLKHTTENYFYLTYGDGLSDVNLKKLSRKYFKSDKLGLVTAVRPPARFGSLELKNDKVTSFKEKTNSNSGWINGGFFILNKDINNYLSNLNEPFEGKPLEMLAKTNNLNAYKHKGYWQCVDTKRDREILENSIKSGELVLYG